MSSDVVPTFDPSPDPDRSLPFPEALERWQFFKRPCWSEGHRQDVASYARRWAQIVGSRPVETIGPGHVQGLYRARDNGSRSGIGLNTERQRFREFFRWCRGLGLVEPGFEPEAAWPRRREIRKRTYLQVTQEQESQLCRALKPRYAKLVRFSLATGLRMGEVRKLRWGWVNADWVLTIPAWARKQGVELRIPLSRKAIEALGERRLEIDLLFPDLPKHRSGINQVLKRAARRTGLSVHISMHQFRRSWVGRLRRANVPIEAVQKLGGWASIVILVKHYWTGVDDDEARDFLNRI